VEIPLIAVPIAIWIGGSFLVSSYASNKGLNSLPFFLASLFFSPAVGFIAAAAAQPKSKQ
jgi:hypothetical protein